MERRTKVLVSSDGELVDGGGNLEALVQDTALSLDADITRPSDETGEIALVGDGLTDSEVLGTGDEERRRDGDSLLGLLVGGGGLLGVSLGRGSSGLDGSGLGSLHRQRDKNKEQKKEAEEEREEKREKNVVRKKKTWWKGMIKGKGSVGQP